MLVRRGCKTIDSQANFVLAFFDKHQFDAPFVFRSLAAQGVLVRLFEDLDAVRITCPGDEDAFQFLVRKLDTILDPKAILFDMDGVLVDEGPSYRESIRQTCEFFGKSISPDEIAEAKLSGDANNDWVFCHRLLTARGVDVEFDVVKERFERIHQGDENAPGLWSREVQLVNVDWLTKIANRFSLGIVTGRPRNDAVRFLRNVGIEHLFSTIICLEDGPTKPDPANVHTAMRNLNVESAWMIGDTPDDINAARAAGVLAVGIPAPDDNVEFATDRLLAAGASAIVPDLKTFGELLP